MFANSITVHWLAGLRPKLSPVVNRVSASATRTTVMVANVRRALLKIHGYLYDSIQLIFRRSTTRIIVIGWIPLKTILLALFFIRPSVRQWSSIQWRPRTDRGKHPGIIFTDGRTVSSRKPNDLFKTRSRGLQFWFFFYSCLSRSAVSVVKTRKRC